MRKRSALPRDVIVLGIIAFCVAVGFGVLLPVLPVFAKSFQVNNLMVGMVISAFALMRLVTSPFCGRIADWMGERTMLTVGVLVVAATSSLAGFAQSYAQLLVFRALGGIGSAMFTVSAMSLLIASVEARMRGRATGVFQGGFLLGGMSGPALGGLIAKISVTAPFHFYALTLTVAAVVGMILLRRPSSPRLDAAKHRQNKPGRPMSEVARDVRYQAACFMSLGQGWNAFGLRNSLTPTLVVEVLHRDPTWTGISFAVASVAQTLFLAPAGRFVDTVGRRPAMIAAGLIGGMAMIAVPFAGSIWALMAILAVFGCAAALLGTAPAASMGDAADGKGGTPVAVFSMFSDLGAILGPLAAGFLADTVSMQAAYAVGGALLLGAAAYSLRMPKGLPAAEGSPR